MYEHHRAVSISYYAETFLPGQDTADTEYMSDKWAHYVDELSFSSHAVTIVGWDDNYPKENFRTAPEGNGAFLIKNSWGSELNDFPNNGYRHFGLLEGQDGVPYDKDAEAVSDRATGYFWLSYYDRSLQGATAFEFDRATGENGYYVEQMDFMQATYADMTTGEPGVRMANVFTAEATAKLYGISVMTTTPGTAVEYEVRLLPDDYSGPEDGLKIAEGEEYFDYGGYHRITLDSGSQKVLARGQKYSVVVREAAEGEEYVCYTMGFASPGGAFQSRAVINPGESFCFAKGEWYDVSDRKVQEAIMEFSYPEDVMDNFPIKSYLDPVTYQDDDQEQVFDGYLTISNWSEGTPGTFQITIDESKTLTAEFRGIRKNMPAAWDPQIIWTSSDPDVVTVTPSTTDFGQAVIRGKNPGTAYLTVDAEDYGLRILRVEVKKLGLFYMVLAKYEFEYTGKPIKPETKYVVGFTNEVHTDGDLTEGVDYVLSYQDNVEIGEGKVIATGIGDYEGTLVEEFSIIEPADHLYGDWTVIKKATCTEDGVREKTCSVCNDKVTEVIPAAGHKWESTYTVDRKATVSAAGSRSIHCSVCDAGKSAVTIPKIKTFKLSAAKYSYNGEIRKPSVTVTDAKGDKLVEKRDYTVVYQSGRKNVGKYSVTVKLKGKYTGSKTMYFKILPRGTTLDTLEPASKAITVKWKKQAAKMSTSRITGYQIQVATDSAFTKNMKKVKVLGYSNTSKKISNLLGEKKYYVRIRAYKKVKGVNYYSKWSEEGKYAVTKK